MDDKKALEHFWLFNILKEVHSSLLNYYLTFTMISWKNKNHKILKVWEEKILITKGKESREIRDY